MRSTWAFVLTVAEQIDAGILEDFGWRNPRAAYLGLDDPFVSAFPGILEGGATLPSWPGGVRAWEWRRPSSLRLGRY
jgi:hypothetical protein